MGQRWLSDPTVTHTKKRNWYFFRCHTSSHGEMIIWDSYGTITSTPSSTAHKNSRDAPYLIFWSREWTYVPKIANHDSCYINMYYIVYINAEFQSFSFCWSRKRYTINLARHAITRVQCVIFYNNSAWGHLNWSTVVLSTSTLSRLPTMFGTILEFYLVPSQTNRLLRK